MGKIVCALPLILTKLILAIVKAMDISADLQTLARHPIALVSAGVKSILDIGRFVFVVSAWLCVADAN